MKKGLVFAAALLFGLTLTGCGAAKNEGEEIMNVNTETVTEIEGYDLFWHDEFDGEKLDTKTWTVEAHKPGFVNH